MSDSHNQDDNGCIVALLVVSIISGSLAFYLYPEGIFNIAFSQLTLGLIVKLIGSVIFGIVAILSGLIVVITIIEYIEHNY